MRKVKIIFIFIHSILICFITGCTVHTHVLDLRSVKQPIQMGKLYTPQVDSLSRNVTSYEAVSGDVVHEIDEGTTSSDENSSLTIGGGEYAKQTLFSAINKVLQDNPDRFIADVQMSAEVEHGISLSAFFGTILGSLLSHDETEAGQFTLLPTLHFQSCD